MKSIFTPIFLVLGIGFLQAQECQAVLSGKIISQDNQEPIMSAKVKVTGSDLVTYTDIDGNYKIEGLCNGEIELEISEQTHQELFVTIAIKGDTKKDIFLNEHEQLQEVVIIGRSTIRRSPTAQEQSISEEDIENFSSSTIGDALKQMSGVSTLNTGKNIVKPVIQGLSSSRVPLFNNGVRMEDQEWGVEHAPNIDLNTAGKLTVVKGAAALQYGGDAIGGVVISDKAKIPRKDTIYGKTILSGETNGRGGSVSSSLSKGFESGFYLTLQGTYKKFGDNEAPNYMLSNTGTSERNFSVNLGLNKSDYGLDLYYSSYNNHLGILRASSTGSVADLVNAINSKEPIYIRDFTYDLAAPRQKVHHQLMRIEAYKNFENLGKLSINYSFQENDRLEYDIRRGANKYKPSVDLNLKTHSASAVFDFNARNDYGVKVGMDWNFKDNFANPDTGVQRIIPDYIGYGFGAFATGFYELNSNWLVEAGLRYDYSHIDAKKYYNKTRWYNQGYDQDFSDLIIGDYGSQYLVNPKFDYNNISATAGVKYDFDSNYELRLNYAMSNRAPNPSELFSDGLHHSAASLEIGQLRLKSENSHKISLCLDKSKGRFNFSISPYLNYINKFINSEVNGLEETVRGVFLRYEYQQMDSRLIGVDVDADYTFNENFSYFGKFSMVDGRETRSGRAIVDIPATNMSHNLTYHNHEWHDLHLGLRGDFHFTKKRYPDDNFTIKVLEDGQYEDRLVDISTPPKGYILTGFDASAVFHPFKKGALQVRFSVDNIFDVEYRNYLNRLRYYAANTGRNFTLQLKINY